MYHYFPPLCQIRHKTQFNRFSIELKS